MFTHTVRMPCTKDQFDTFKHLFDDLGYQVEDTIYKDPNYIYTCNLGGKLFVSLCYNPRLSDLPKLNPRDVYIPEYNSNVFYQIASLNEEGVVRVGDLVITKGNVWTQDKTHFAHPTEKEFINKVIQITPGGNLMLDDRKQILKDNCKRLTVDEIISFYACHGWKNAIDNFPVKGVYCEGSVEINQFITILNWCNKKWNYYRDDVNGNPFPDYVKSCLFLKHPGNKFVYYLDTKSKDALTLKEFTKTQNINMSNQSPVQEPTPSMASMPDYQSKDITIDRETFKKVIEIIGNCNDWRNKAIHFCKDLSFKDSIQVPLEIYNGGYNAASQEQRIALDNLFLKPGTPLFVWDNINDVRVRRFIEFVDKSVITSAAPYSPRTNYKFWSLNNPLK